MLCFIFHLGILSGNHLFLLGENQKYPNFNNVELMVLKYQQDISITFHKRTFFASSSSDIWVLLCNGGVQGTIAKHGLHLQP